ENPLAAAAEGIFERYAAKMEAFAYGDAAKEIMDLIHAANHYIEESEPWTLAKDPAKAGELANVIWNLLEAIRISAHLLMPL
ncbi:class I tRNA ligase family protein, partial [Escherichia coli]